MVNHATIDEVLKEFNRRDTRKNDEDYANVNEPYTGPWLDEQYKPFFSLPDAKQNVKDLVTAVTTYVMMRHVVTHTDESQKAAPPDFDAMQASITELLRNVFHFSEEYIDDVMYGDDDEDDEDDA